MLILRYSWNLEIGEQLHDDSNWIARIIDNNSDDDEDDDDGEG